MRQGHLLNPPYHPWTAVSSPSWLICWAYLGCRSDRRAGCTFTNLLWEFEPDGWAGALPLTSVGADILGAEDWLGLRASELEPEIKSSCDGMDNSYHSIILKGMDGGCNREFADRQAASGVQSVYIVLGYRQGQGHGCFLPPAKADLSYSTALPVLPRKLLSTASSPLHSMRPWRCSSFRCPHEPSFPEFCLCWPQPCPAKTFASRKHEVRLLHHESGITTSIVFDSFQSV